MTSTVAELKQVAIVNSLRTCQLFGGSPTQDLENIAAITVVKSLAKGEYLFRERDVSRGFYIVQRGAVNAHPDNALVKPRAPSPPTSVIRQTPAPWKTPRCSWCKNQVFSISCASTRN
jgi:hypothetical protein